MTEKFRVMMILKEEMALIVNMPKHIVKFKEFSNSLYGMIPNDRNSFVITKQDYQFMNKLKENLKCLSTRQQKRAKKS